MSKTATDSPDIFASFLPDVVLEPKSSKNGAPDWDVDVDGPIPQNAYDLVKLALSQPNENVTFPWPGEELADLFRRALRAAIKEVAPGYTVYVRTVKAKDAEGNDTDTIDKFSFTAGKPRGRKKTETATEGASE
jgi:hypothetical protein